ncbi:MAG: zf-TFIIB domain-containing protein [Fuerstiella sp.]
MIAPKTSYPCQQCGGTATAVPGRDYLQCRYCQSLVFTTDNPLTVDRITPMGTELDGTCPACEQTLCTGEIEQRAVLYCGGCFGLLLRNEDFGAIVRQRRARRIGCEAESVQPLNPDEYNRQLGCPNCHQTMEVHPYYGPGNIVMDSCARCQYVWLDHGELRTVERAEGGREPQPLPLQVNADGDVTVIPPPETGQAGAADPERSPLSVLADLLFGF